MTESLEFDLAQGWSKGLSIVFENATTSKKILDQTPGDFLSLKQIHGKEILEVGSGEFAKGIGDGLLARGDAFKKSRKKLLVRTADCIPLVYVDVQSEALAILHAGWRGLALGIHRIPFERGWFNPKTTWAWIGPSLSGDDFEVRQDMWEQFPKFKDDAEIFAPKSGETKKSDSRFFHPWRFLEKDLKPRGLELLYNVEVNTFRDENYASYRRAKKAGLEKSPTYNASWVGFR